MDIRNINKQGFGEINSLNQNKNANISNKSNNLNFEELIRSRLNNIKATNDIINAQTSRVQKTRADGEITFSKHAQERLSSRNVEISGEFIEKMNGALCKASQKGIRNALMISGESAFIVNVDSGTVITAMNIDEMRNNIITNIDGTVIL